MPVVVGYDAWGSELLGGSPGIGIDVGPSGAIASRLTPTLDVY